VGLAPVAINHLALTADRLTPQLMREVWLTRAGHAPVTLTGACRPAAKEKSLDSRNALVSTGLLGWLQ
jgi:hypothetical protein